MPTQTRVQKEQAIAPYTFIESLLASTRSPEHRTTEKKLGDNGRMYAIAFDLDTNTLAQTYHAASYNNAYSDIRARLINNHGFTWQQGSVYFGGETVNAVSCVLAVIDLTNAFDWFAASVRDIRMLRIEEQNDLMPAIQQAANHSTP